MERSPPTLRSRPPFPPQSLIPSLDHQAALRDQRNTTQAVVYFSANGKGAITWRKDYVLLLMWCKLVFSATIAHCAYGF